VAGVVSLVIVVAVLAAIVSSRSDGGSSSASAAATVLLDPDSVPPAVVATSTTPVPTVSLATTTEPAATTTSSPPASTVPSTTAPSTTSTAKPRSTAPAAPRTTVPRPPAPATTAGTASVAPVGTAAPAPSNCTTVGTLSIPRTGIEQPLIAERTAFRDGLLCGNHSSDHSPMGVDVLPGYASLADSVAGGSALAGKVPTVIFGHRKSHNHPFLENPSLQAGDPVVITNDDGSEIHLHVTGVRLVSLDTATRQLLAPSPDGTPLVRLVCCSHADGSPGGVNYRWIVELAPD
jgi:Sortase domain